MHPVRLRQRVGKHRPRTQLQLRPQLIIAELVVPLIRNAIDDRIFNDLHHQVIAGAAEANVLEQARCIQRLQAAIDPVRIKPVAGLNQQVGPYGPFLDPLSPFHLDRLDDTSGLSGRRPGRSRTRRRRPRGVGGRSLGGGCSESQKWHQAG